MIDYSRRFSVFAAVVALASCAYMTGSPRTQSDEIATKAIPTGSDTPEGVACDLVRSYIEKDAGLFHERRSKVSCENAFDAKVAYESLVQYEPLLLNTSSLFTQIPSEGLKIKKVCIKPKAVPAEASLTWDVASGLSCNQQFDLNRFDLFINYGAFESKLVDVVAQSHSGQEYLFCVEAMQYPKTTNDAFHNPVPGGVWRGRLIAATE